MKSTENKNVILTPKAQWSLVLFFLSFIINLLSTTFAGRFIPSEGTTSFLPIFLPIIFVLAVYSGSIILGLQSLSYSKFPLLWVVPCLIISIPLSYTLWNDYSRISADTTLSKTAMIDPQKAIGVIINSSPAEPTQIISVYLNSAAEISGLQNGDIIININGKDTSSRNDIVNYLESTQKLINH